MLNSQSFRSTSLSQNRQIRNESFLYIRREKREKKMARELLGEDLRGCINNSLQNIGIISAFMCALAGCIFVEPVEDPECHGEAGLKAMFWLLWMSMGMFFLSICATFILANDINAFPNNLILVQLYKMESFYAMPGVFSTCGIFLLATAYGIDIDMRTNCKLSFLGVVLAPMFPLCVCLIAWHLRKKRRDMNGIAHDLGHRKDMEFGTVWFTTWRERCFLANMKGADNYLFDVICPHCAPFMSTDAGSSSKSMGQSARSFENEPLQELPKVPHF